MLIAHRCFARARRVGLSAAVAWALLPAGGPSSSGLAPGAAVARAQEEVQVYLSTADALALAYPDADRFEVEEVPITPELGRALEERLKQRFPFRGVRIHHAWLGDRHLGRAVVTEEIGKYRPMTFLVALDDADVVRRVDLLVFRESHGYQVEGRTFMDQFAGLSRKDPIRVGKDIDAVSGATLSARGISKGVKRMLYFFEVLDRRRADAAETAP